MNVNGKKDDLKLFDELGQTYSTWIIKYCSTSFGNPIFLIWYTDTDAENTDRLLTYQTGEIFAIRTLKNLNKSLFSRLDELIVFENLTPWLYSIKDLKAIEFSTYDLQFLENEISKENWDIPTLNSFVNFFNLFGDLVYQDARNRHLEIYSQDKLLRKVWDYYYDSVFWPTYTSREQMDVEERPTLIIESKEVLMKLKKMIREFDKCIKLAESDTTS